MMAGAEQQKRILEAEGQANAAQRIGEGNAGAIRAEGLAQAQVIEAKGRAEAEVIRQKGLAEADAMMKKADAWQNYNQAAVIEKVIEVLPSVASAIAQPLARTERIVMVNTGGDGVGASKLTHDITNVIAELPPVIEALSGINFHELLQKLPQIGAKPAAAAPAQPAAPAAPAAPSQS